MCADGGGAHRPARCDPTPRRAPWSAPPLRPSFVHSTCCVPGSGRSREGGGQRAGGPPGRTRGRRDPPLPVGASLCSAGMQHAAAVAEGEPAGLPGLGEHCRGGGGNGSQGLPRRMPSDPHHPPHSTPQHCGGPPRPPSGGHPPPPPRSSPNAPVPPGLLEGAPLGRGVSPPPGGPSAWGAPAAAVLGVAEVTRVTGVTVALCPGGSLWLWEGPRGL